MEESCDSRDSSPGEVRGPTKPPSGKGSHLSALTAEFVARFERGLPNPRARTQPPEHALPFTLIAVATAFALLFLPTGQLNYPEVSAAATFAAALLVLALCWSVAPRVATLGIPFGYVLLAALLREAAGGSASGFGGLFLLPVLWLAVTAGRRELGAILAAMAAAQLVPLEVIGAPEYPESGWRGALVLTTVAAITGLMVQRLVDDARQRTALLEEQTERLLEVDRLKDQFVATASHELRTPLTSLSGYLEMSLDPAEGPLSPAREKHLRIVQRNADRLAILVEQLLFLARADSHPLELDRRAVDLDEILNESAETARPAAAAKNVALIVEPGTAGQALADRLQILRVVDNLVTNAIKFTPDGGTVRLAARRDGAKAILEVKDTGAGIRPGEQQELFNRFFRGKDAIEDATPGSGLGLAISQVIAEAHGSTIRVESIHGAGSTFSLALPLA
jgi:signal transduction histidine kinase